MAPVTALAGGVTRSWAGRPGRAGRRPGGPVPGSGRGRQRRAPAAGLAGCREWRCGRLAWIIVGIGIFPRGT